jgi:hypothetical protein
LYSQTGATEELAESICRPLGKSGYTIEIYRIRPKEAYSFPWKSYDFFDAFPETVNEVPMELELSALPSGSEYEFIILGYQPWFLSVSRPVMSFLKTDEARHILSGKPVVTFLGCRNMWITAQMKMKHLLSNCGAEIKGQIALTDRHGNLTSLVTVLGWMLKGKREGFMGLPRSGVSREDIRASEAYGQLIADAFQNQETEKLQEKLILAGAVHIRTSLYLMEKRGSKNFRFWAKFIAQKGGPGDRARSFRLNMFRYLLPTAIVILTPVTSLLKPIMHLSVRKSLKREIDDLMKS